MRVPGPSRACRIGACPLTRKCWSSWTVRCRQPNAIPPDPLSPEEQAALAEWNLPTFVAMLLWYSRGRPDLALVASVICSHAYRPCPTLLTLLHQVCQYILWTLEMGLMYHADKGPDHIVFYTDSNFPFGRPRISYVAMFKNAAIDWFSSKSPTVPDSTASSEIGGAITGAKRAFTREPDFRALHFLKDQTPMDFRQDNQTALSQMTGESLCTSVAKHMNQKTLAMFHVLKEGRINMSYCRTTSMKADGLNKLLPTEQWCAQRDEWHGMSPRGPPKP